MLIAQDHDPSEMLETGGIQLAYRYLETIQHTDDDFRNRKPQTTVHQERHVASKITLRRIISVFPTTRNSKLYRVWNTAERSDGLEEFTSAPARQASCGNRNSHCRFPFKLRKLENPSFPEVPDIC
ncbi:hypothetical protein F2Q69_00015189 [Brassica cretica]|uniref:Uncharacterized protein n=1 Tax=Brassica cretica TaxID=69181 RepID=A0A8S9QZ02_BRACR|nr:hypothetical protein F2Q69_00015189 [Brassica cretica]